MHRLGEMTSDLLLNARVRKEKSQQYMADRLGRSLSTIQNWENGASVPKMTDVLDWFGILGINPLRACLDYVHPCTYSGIAPDSDIEEIDIALMHYLRNIASERERRELAFCIFGPTGSSWAAQLDELTARNHLPIAQRVSISRITVETYGLARDTGRLRRTDHILPDIDNVERAIENCKDSVRNGRSDYQNI